MFLDFLNLFTSPKLQVIVLSQDETLYEGPAVAVSTVNQKGPLDILYYHTNFISLIQNQVKVLIDDKTTKEFNFPKGVIKCYNNTVEVFLGVD